MNFKDIIRKEFLFESKKEVAGALKIFYSIDIKIKEDSSPIEQPKEPVAPPVQEPAPVEQQPVEQPAQQPAQQPVVQQENINEEEDDDDDDKTIVKKLDGVLTLTKEDADNIQSIEDLIDFMADKKNNGEKILDELTVEVITALIMAPDAMKTNEIIKKDDQIIITIYYGYKKENSIGFKILKRKGVSSVSTIMLKDNEVLDSQFDFRKFNSQIVDYRNEWLNK
jgi:hypothetical protein